MRSLGALVAGGLLLLGCSYHNVVYNATGLLAEAEEHRRAGRDSASIAAYREVVQKTGDAYRARSDAEWIGEALVLLGKAHLRLGHLREARATFDEADTRTADPTLRNEILVYRGAVRAESGDRVGAVRALNEALDGELGRVAQADAHLLRGRLMLSAGRADQGWWDLDRAVEATSAVRVEAGLERFRWSVHQGDVRRSREAIESLFGYPEGGARLDTLDALVDDAERRWGAWTVAGMLGGADDSAWDRAARGHMALRRAELLDSAGDSTAAFEQAFRVAAGLGESAAEARLLIASWRLSSAEDLQQASAVRPILLPAEVDSRVVTLLGALDDLEAYAAGGLENALGWFAAAEIARDRLGAPYLARGLFLAYADGASDEPWVAKAVLAAIDVSPEVEDRAWLRGRLEAYQDSPYVLATLGGSAAGFEALEEELEVRLRELRR